MSFTVRPARRGEAKPLVGLFSESGRGKTWSALLLARGFVGKSGKIVMIETEAGRGEIYADMLPGGYDVISVRENFSPERFGEAITTAEAATADALIIDSASHEWESDGGVLAMAAENQRTGKKGPLVWQMPKILHKRHFMLRLLSTPIPLVIVCMRAKYPMKEVTKDGRKEWVRSDVLEPIQADDVLYEMTVHGWIDSLHRLHVTKYTRPDLENVIKNCEPITIETGRALAVWASGCSAVSPLQTTSPAVASTDSPPAATSVLDQADEALAIAACDQALARAADEGMDALAEAWNDLETPMRKHLKAALDRRHKPRAMRSR